jgi:hypothetical protein
MLLNDFVRPRPHRRWDREAEGFGGLEVDHEFVHRSWASLGPAATSRVWPPSRQRGEEGQGQAEHEHPESQGYSFPERG